MKVKFIGSSIRRKKSFFEVHGYQKKIYVFFWGLLSLSAWGFVIWPFRHHGGWQCSLEHRGFGPRYFGSFKRLGGFWDGIKTLLIPSFMWSCYWLNPKRARLERRLLIIRWLSVKIWLDLWTIGRIKRDKFTGRSLDWKSLCSGDAYRFDLA